MPAPYVGALFLAVIGLLCELEARHDADREADDREESNGVLWHRYNVAMLGVHLGVWGLLVVPVALTFLQYAVIAWAYAVARLIYFKVRLNQLRGRPALYVGTVADLDIWMRRAGAAAWPIAFAVAAAVLAVYALAFTYPPLL